jgi:EAL and modified HD-GYP domain-containing signal transduction protein
MQKRIDKRIQPGLECSKVAFVPADKDSGVDRLATQPESATTGTDPTHAEWAGEVRYVARQPILDLHGRVHGYALLFRDGTDAVFRGDGAVAARTILDDTVLFGLERYTNGLTAFINCSAETLTERLVQVLPPGKTALLIPGSAQPTPRLLEACCELKASGFRLALDDFAWNPNIQPLLEIAEYVCVDFSLLDVAGREKLGPLLKQFSAAKVARKVETQKDFEQACAAGFTLFQGNFFCHPVLLKDRKVPTNRFFHFELLRHLNRDPFDLRKVADLVERDTSLTYRLLRLVNSPFCALRQEVRSIESALIIVGEATFRRVATLAILSELNNGRPSEILQTALVRARFCALSAGLCGSDPAEQYLLGMLSLLPAMLGLPMEALTPSLPLRSQIRDALEGTANPERNLLAWFELHERGDWAACDPIAEASHLTREQLAGCYADSIDWAKTTLSSAA